MQNDRFVGKIIEDRYVVEELIGSGGMAKVYRAHDAVEGGTVAVKILRDEFSGNAEFLRRFKNESKAIALLNHPNIVRVFDVSFNEDISSIIMEYTDGITLKEYIEHKKIIEYSEAIHFTLQILRALQHAHDRGLVHRDIKPQNIMLLGDGTIKVADFGIARFARNKSLTVTDKAIGSVHYISPEQAMSEATDEKSDIYSVGVMLFEMLTGKLPFDAETAVSVAIKQIQSEAVRPTAINPTIPLGLEQITLHAMQKNAGYRYQSAAEMISDIERFEKNPDIRFKYSQPAEKNISGRSKIRNSTQGRTEETGMYTKRKTPYISILTGVTMAFVFASGIFVASMVYFNNPFTKVPDMPVPKLVGLKYETAAAQHTQITIKVQESDYSDEYAKGVIFEQSPKYGGVEMKVSETVKVKLSLGPRKVTLANFANQSVTRVMTKLREDGLQPREQQEFSDTTPVGSVIFTDPSKGSTLSSGDVVTVYVSVGPKEQLVEVPGDIIGMDLNGAAEYLNFYLLKIGTVTEKTSDMPVGVIIETDPPAGTMHPQDSSINVVISRGAAEKINLSIALPDTKKTISVRVRDTEQNVLDSATIEPGSERRWTALIQMEEDQTKTVNIYLSEEGETGKLYQSYLVSSFADREPPRLVKDNSSSATFKFE